MNLNNSLQARVQVNRVNLENKTVENEDKTLISLRSSFSELVFDQSSFEWHQDQSYLDLLRVRFILCMSDRNAPALDYIAQRFSEFQEKTRLEATPANPRDRNLNLEEMYNTTTVNLLGGSTYRDNQDILFQIGNGRRNPTGNRKDYLLGSRIRAEFAPPSVYPYQNVSPSVIYREPLFYNEDQRLQDLITYDAPLNNLLSRDSDGNIVLTQDRTDISNPNGRGYYVRQNATLNEIKIMIGEGERFTNTDIQHMSIYAYVYLDMDAFNQQFNIDPIEIPGTEVDSSVFYMGMGPIFAGTYIGNKTAYKPIEIFTSTNQQGQRVYTTSPQNIGPEISAVIPSPTADRLDDLRMLSRGRRQLFQDPKDPLYNEFVTFRELANEKVYQVISRNTIGQQNNKILKKDNYFTDIWISKDNNNNVRYVFGFDLQKYMATNATFPALYLNESSSPELLGEKENMIKNISIKRRKLNKSSYQNTNDLGTYSKENPNPITETNPEYIIGSPTTTFAPFLNLDNINENEETCMLFFQGIDKFENMDNNAPEQEKMAVRQIFGKFEYGVDIVVEDRSLNYVLTQLNRVKAAQKEVQLTLSSYINDPNLYDFSNNLLLISNDDMQLLRSQVGLYISTLRNFGVQDTESISLLLNTMLTSMKPGAIDEVQRTIGQLVYELSTLIRNNYGITETVKDAIIDISARGTYENKIPLSTIQHYFSANVEYGIENGFGADYFNGSYGFNNGPLTITLFDFLDRCEKEFSKYFYRPEDPELGLSFSQGVYDNPGISYFSPRIIYTPGKDPLDQLFYFPFDKKNIAEYNLDKYAEVLVDIIKTKHQTKYLDFAFYQDQDPNSPPSNKAKKLLEDYESCLILDNEQSEFTVPRPSANPDRFRVDAERLSLLSRGLVPGILGGLNLSPVDRAFIDERQQSDINLDVIQPELVNVDDLDIRRALNPVKLIYGFFGELELNPSLTNVDYMDQAFNSFTNLREQLNLNSANIVDSLSSASELGFLPNQLKSMLLVATTQEQTLLEGIFDARRIFLKDKDFADEDAQNIFADDKISFFAPRAGDNNPPFSITEDPMKIYAKFLAFWLNYKNLVVVEYLSGFEDLTINNSPASMVIAKETPGGLVPLEEGEEIEGLFLVEVPEYEMMGYDNVSPRQPLGNVPAPLRTNIPKKPVWKKLNRSFIDTLEEGGPRQVLCRIRPLVNLDLLESSNTYANSNINFISETPEKLVMPTYNKYFYLTQDTISSVEPGQIPYTSVVSQLPEAIAERREQLARAGEDTPVAGIRQQIEGVSRMDADTLQNPSAPVSVAQPITNQIQQQSQPVTLPQRFIFRAPTSVTNVTRQNIQSLGTGIRFGSGRGGGLY